jgi:hypothetical protein
MVVLISASENFRYCSSCVKKNELATKNGQIWLENNHLDSLIYIRDTHCTSLSKFFYLSLWFKHDIFFFNMTNQKMDNLYLR